MNMQVYIGITGISTSGSDPAVSWTACIVDSGGTTTGPYTQGTAFPPGVSNDELRQVIIQYFLLNFPGGVTPSLPIDFTILGAPWF